jgi:TRAP-type C4-dicarboxylate transport system permease small subunit
MPPPRRTSVEGVIAVLLFAALIGVVIVQILGRTPVMTGPVWTEEAARWLWVWMAFIGIAEVERQDQHLRMGFLAEMLPAVVRRVVFTVIDLIWLGVVLHLAWIGWGTVQRTASHAAVSMPVPNAALYAAGAVAFALVAHRIARRILAGRSAATVSGPAL